MYHILIVDDEPILCEAMQLKIDLLNTQHKLNINKISTASSVKEAIDIIENEAVHILITDMKMPGKNGLDLIQYIQEKSYPIVSVVLSGYSDFEYVKTAFQHGAIDYLLKPIKLSQLNDALKKCFTAINTYHEISHESTVNPRQAFVAQLEHYCNSLLTEHSEQETPPKDIKSYFPNLCFEVAVFSANKQIDCCKLIERFQNQDSTDIYPFVCFHDHYQNVVLIFNLSPEISAVSILAYLKKLHHFLEEQHCPCRCSLSHIQTGFQHYTEMYEQALYHLSYQMIKDFNVIASFQEEAAPKDEELNELYHKYNQKISFAFQTKDFERINNLINNIFTKEFFEGGRPSNIISFFHFYLMQVQNLSSSMKVSISRIKSFYSFQSLNEIRLYLKELLYQLQQKSEVSEINQYLPLINTAVQYIEDNFNKDISMTDVANSVSMSYNYFSKLFKEQTHCTFSEYLTQVRMREARFLLKDPGKKIKDIAVQVGYESVYSFSRAFKQYYGVSPKDLRNK